MAADSDAAAIEAVLAGDRNAYETIVIAHQDAVFRLLYRIVKSQEEAEDLAQEAFLRAYSNLGKFDRSRPFRPWLLTIATNLALSRIRRQRQTEPLEDHEWRLTEPEESSPPHRVEAEQRRSMLRRAIDRLPDTIRTLMHLHYEEELPIAEAARMTGKTEGAAKTALHRARELLKEIVKREAGGGQP